jgi:hypothetical protein
VGNSHTPDSFLYPLPAVRPFGRFSAFRVLSARNGVLAREIEPSE